MLRRLTRCSSLCGESKLKAFCFQWRVPAAPREAGALRGGAGAPSSALLPMRGRSAPPTPGDFLFEKKVTKDSPGGHPWTPEGGTLSPLRRCRTPQIGLSATTKDRFATLSWWANRSFFLPKLHRGSHLQLSIRGAAVRFSFWVLPGVAALSGGSGEAAGGMIMPPTGVQGASPLTRLW